MMIDLEQLKADREAGTDGPWWTDAKYSGREAGCSIIAARTDSGPLPGNPTRGAVAFTTALLNTEARRCEANARRIARLPELEAAYIEVVAKLDKAVEALQEVDDTLAKLSGSLAELDAALLAQEIAVIALERENIAPLITAKSERDE